MPILGVIGATFEDRGGPGPKHFFNMGIRRARLTAHVPKPPMPIPTNSEGPRGVRRGLHGFRAHSVGTGLRTLSKVCRVGSPHVAPAVHCL